MGCAGSKPTQPVQGRDSRSALRGPSPDLTSEHHVVASDSSKGADSKTRVHKLRVSVGSVSGLASLNNYVVVSHRDLGARTRVVYGSKSPAFNEVVDIVTVHEPRDVDVSVRTYNRLRKDHTIGRVKLPLPEDLFSDTISSKTVTASIQDSEGRQRGEVKLVLSGIRLVGQRWHLKHELSYANTLGLLSMHVKSGHLSPELAASVGKGKVSALRPAVVVQLAGNEFRTGSTTVHSSDSGVNVEWGQAARTWVQAESARHVLRILLMQRDKKGAGSRLLAAGSLSVQDVLSCHGETLTVRLARADAKDLSTDALLSKWKVMQRSAASGPGSPAPGSATPGQAPRSAEVTPVAAAAAATAAVAASEVKEEDATFSQPEDVMFEGGEPVVATVQVKFSFSSKAEAEAWFMRSLMDQFDTDGDGKLSVEELAGMLTVLTSAFPGDGAGDKAAADAVRGEAGRLMAMLDTSGDQQVDEGEVMAILRSTEFQTGPFGYSILNFLADGYEARHALMNLHPIVRKAGESAAGADMVTVSAGGVSTVDRDGLMVFDDATGITVREHIPGYVKAALDVAYKGLFDSTAFVQSSAMRAMLRAMTVKEGKHMNSSASAAEIPDFVSAHRLNTEEIRDPLDSFKTFNEFFYRKLKPEARPIAAPGDPAVAVSPADCRMVAFPFLHEATSLWVKGAAFTIDTLLGPELAEEAPKFYGGSLVIARLAPQDYHRWHMPVTGTLRKPVPIAGDLFTVNPIAIRRAVNVYTENKRIVCLVDTEHFGTVAMVAVGATMVGSINLTTPPEGGPVEKGQEHGYFAFGGSTVLVLFQPKSIWLDDGIVRRSRLPMETLVQMGRAIGVPYAQRPTAASAGAALPQSAAAQEGKASGEGKEGGEGKE